MKPEITEEKDDEEETCCLTGDQRDKIRRIIEYQKSIYLSSASSSFSSSSSSASCSSFSSSRRRSTLLELMKGGSTSLRRLFDMEHTSLATIFDNYSGSPIIKTIPLWGSDTDDELNYDPWANIKQIGSSNGLRNDERSNFASDGSFKNEESGFKNMKPKMSHRKLRRKKSYRRLPGFGLWKCRGFGFRLRLRRRRIMIFGRKM
ncbi:hypothetical protein Patl1_31678 [Pistacia atlantica]|uniref:Uncharacterized protein n=1 Tax=Pistacia atlantica TaxID=434234 RepID=A0ACC1AR66_9ROSI|nr:hypothetical protein Patl1_31678 [Pistacia atlantica]